MFGAGQVDINIAQGAKIQVSVLRRALDPAPGRLLEAHAAGGTDDHACANGFERVNDSRHVRKVSLPDARFVRAVMMIVHAVTGRGHGRLETQDIVGHAGQKSAGLFAAPAKLPGADAQFRQRDGQVGFHDPAIHALFGDRITTDRQTVAGVKDRFLLFGRRLGLKFGEERIVRFLFEGNGHCRKKQRLRAAMSSNFSFIIIRGTVHPT